MVLSVCTVMTPSFTRAIASTRIGARFSRHTARRPTLVAIAPTDAEAEEVARRGARWTVGAYANPKSLGEMRLGSAPAMDPVERYLNGVVVHGSPARVVDELERLRSEMFLDYLLLAPLSEKSFQLFTDEVLPKIGRS